MFHEGDGQDKIKNFGCGSGRSGERPSTYEDYVAAEKKALANGWTDIIQLHLNATADDTSDQAAFESLNIRQDGDHTVIGYGDSGDTITLFDTKMDSLSMDDFKFVFIAQEPAPQKVFMGQRSTRVPLGAQFMSNSCPIMGQGYTFLAFWTKIWSCAPTGHIPKRPAAQAPRVASEGGREVRE